MATRSLVGKTVGKYKIVQHLGRGGMAVVYKGYQEALDRHVAIKLMHSFLSEDQDFLHRFQREARAMAALNHPYIVSVYDFDVEDDTYYIVMEYVSGGTLKEKLEALASEGQQLSLANTIQTVLEIADALAYAHSRSMVHRDIKPANIMINAEGKAVLTDFGIAKILSGPSYTATGAMIGTPAYMSPEQGQGHPGDERSDLYSLGVLFYQMAAGRLPYDADTPLAVVLKHVNEPIPLLTTFNPNIPPSVQEIIFKSMAKDPNERFQTAHEMAKALRDLVRQEDLGLAMALPVELLRDRPTPAPQQTVAGQTYSGEAEATRLAVGGSATVMGSVAPVSGAVDATTVAPPSFVPPSPNATSSYRPWLWVGGFVGLLLLIGLVMGGAALAVTSLGGDNDDAAPGGVAQVDTTTPTATIPVTPSVTPTPFDVAAEVAAALTEVAANLPTNTPTLTPSATPTSTPTPDMTATLLAGCVWDAALVTAHTYQSRQSQSAPVGASFPITWILKNSGSCAWPADLQLVYQSGEQFGDREAAPLTAVPAPGAEISLQATNFRAPSTAGNYESVWQLIDAEGEPLGDPIVFSFQIYVPATATPTRPPASPTPAVTPTSAAELNAIIDVDVNSCEYAGDQWRCLLIIQPYGGGGGPYVVWVDDTAPPAHYDQVTTRALHWIQRRRCFTWTQTITIRDEATATQRSFGRGYDPNNLFPGGCVLP
jgi:tRNA A-37 threonylcarbamoyl transferase component Bud32